MSCTEICNKALKSLDGNTSANGTSDYVPAVGDVVEFEYRGKTCKGLVFNPDFKPHLCIASNFAKGGNHWGFNSCKCKEHGNTRKIGHCDLVPNKCISMVKAFSFAEAYFSAPTFTGSYEEQQAQWIKHYGLKVGSKVKVVRSFEDGEGGYTKSSWGNNGLKDTKYLGNVFSIKDTYSSYIVVDASYFPYFVLEAVTD